MPDPYRKVQRGQKLKGGVSATAWNAFIDNVKFGGRTGAGLPTGFINPANTAILRWPGSSIATLAAFSVQGYGPASTDPADNAFIAQGRPVFDGASPSADKPFVITLDNILGQTAGTAAVSGLVPVQVDITDTTHRRARPIDGTTANLTSCESGGVPITIPQAFTDTGVQWCFVLLCFPDTPAEEISSSSSSSTSGGGVEIVSDVSCDAGGLLVDHKMLTGYVTINGRRYPVSFDLT